jgi:small conductance mechanosensitive channel
MLLLFIEETVATGYLDKGVGYVEKLKGKMIDALPGLVGAILVYIIGKWLIGRACVLLQRVLTLRHIDPSLQTFLMSLARISMIVLLFLTIAGMIGINVTGFAALLAGAGIAIGSALNGSLGNLAGGVMILIFKPFKVGDQIEAQGAVGVVREIGIFSTQIITGERKIVILPNGALSTGVITNYTASGSLRVDIPFNIATTVPVDHARQVAINTMLQHPLVLKDPAPEVVVTKIADGMVTLSLRPSALQADYGLVFTGVQEMVKNAFDIAGIDGPVPQRIILNK